MATAISETQKVILRRNLEIIKQDGGGLYGQIIYLTNLIDSWWKEKGGSAFPRYKAADALRAPFINNLSSLWYIDDPHGRPQELRAENSLETIDPRSMETNLGGNRESLWKEF